MGRDLQGNGGRFPESPYFDPGEFVSSNLPGAPVVRDEYLFNPPGVTWQASEDESLADDGSADIPEVSLPKRVPAWAHLSRGLVPRTARACRPVCNPGDRVAGLPRRVAPRPRWSWASRRSVTPTGRMSASCSARAIRSNA